MPIVEWNVLTCEIGVVEASYAVMIVHEVMIELAIGIVPKLVIGINDSLVIVKYL